MAKGNIALSNTININAIYTIHYFKYGKNFKYKLEKHNFYELVYIDSGNAIVVSNDKKYLLKQGEAFLHLPNDKHTIYTSNNFANSAIISFENKNKALACISNKIINFTNDNKNLLYKIINEAKLCYGDPLDDLDLTMMNKNDIIPFGSEQVIKNNIELLLISLVRQNMTDFNNIAPLLANYSKLVEKILDILREKASSINNVNLKEISYDTGYSISYIKTRFKKEVGKSIVQFFIDMKIDKAKQLLSHNDNSINEISDILGFSSVQYFCRLFKQRTGMTPSNYINSIKTDHLL